MENTSVSSNLFSNSTSNTSTVAPVRLSQTEQNLLFFGMILRVYVAPFVEVLGGVNNIFVIIIVSVFSSKKTKDSVNQSNNAQVSRITFIPSYSNVVLDLSRSAKIYFTAIAVADISVLWSSVFQRGWIRDVFGLDPTSINAISCKVFQTLFNIFLLGNSW
jgi:hypothetical protein